MCVDYYLEKLLYPPCNVDINVMLSLFSSTYFVWPTSSQSESFTSTKIPGRTSNFELFVSVLSLRNNSLRSKLNRLSLIHPRRCPNVHLLSSLLRVWQVVSSETS